MNLLRALAVTVVLTLTGAHGAEARQIPERLSDAEFWGLVGALSEPGGYFRSDNFISNENELQYLIPDLQRTVPRGRVYVGVGPEQNLTYIASLEPAVAFIVDIRRQNMIQHLYLKVLMEASADRAEFLSKLFARPRPAGVDSASTALALFTAFAAAVPDSLLYRRTFAEASDRLTKQHGFALTPEDMESLRYVAGAFAEAGPDITYSFGAMNNTRMGMSMPTLAEMMTETDAEGTSRSYLATEELFRRIRDMHRRNLIVPVVGDFGGDKALRSVAAWIRGQQGVLGVFYSSNVEQYLFQQGDAAARFYDNLGAFPTDSTTQFIRSAMGRGGLVPTRNPRSRLAQIAVPMDWMLKEIREGRVNNYIELVLLRP